MVSDNPLGGKKIHPAWLIMGGGAALFVGYKWFVARSAAAAAPIQVDPSTGLPIDPSTGLPITSGGDVGGIYQNPAPSSGNTSDTPASGITTNQQWTQAGVTYMEGLGYDPNTVLTALSQVLANQQVSSAQATIWHEVVAAIGSPPVGAYAVIQGTGTPSTGARTLPYVVTGKNDTTPATLAETVYGLSPTDYINVSYDDVMLAQANPGTLGQNVPLAAGTTVTVPVIKLNTAQAGRTPTAYNQG
jgi:hypothetical protein